MARTFDAGSSQYLETASAPMTGAPFSMACWVWTDDSSADKPAMCLSDISAGDEFYQLHIAANDKIKFRARQGDQEIQTSAGVSMSTWHHILGVEAASNDRRVYLDGGSKSTGNTECTPTGNIDTISIGRVAKAVPMEYFDGSIAEAAIWNVALTDADALILAAGYSPLCVKPASIVAYWTLVRDDDRDLVGSYSLTDNGGPTVGVHPRIIYPGMPMVGLGGTDCITVTVTVTVTVGPTVVTVPVVVVDPC